MDLFDKIEDIKIEHTFDEAVLEELSDIKLDYEEKLSILTNFIKVVESTDDKNKSNIKSYFLSTKREAESYISSSLKTAQNEIERLFREHYNLNKFYLPDIKEVDIDKILNWVKKEYPDLENEGLEQHKKMLLNSSKINKSWRDKTYEYKVKLSKNVITFKDSIYFDRYSWSRTKFDTYSLSDFTKALKKMLSLFFKDKNYNVFGCFWNDREVDFTREYETRYVSFKLFKNNRLDIKFQNAETALKFYNFCGYKAGELCDV